MFLYILLYYYDIILYNKQSRRKDNYPSKANKGDKTHHRLWITSSQGGFRRSKLER